VPNASRRRKDVALEVTLFNRAERSANLLHDRLPTRP
jgi:hypothetical protein